MKLGIVIYSHDAETVWNAFRLGNYALKEGDHVKVFLLANGVEYESLSSSRFDILKQAQELLDHGGELLACGTCLKLRQKEGSDMCPMSTMKDLHALAKESDKVLTF